VASLAGWITRQQDAVIEFLREENRVLKQQLGGKRLRLTDAQRRRLAVRGKAIGRRALTGGGSLVIELATRRIDVVGITPGPNEAWMMLVGWNLTDLSTVSW